MSTIIRASDRNRTTHGVAFNFDDMAAQAEKYLAKIRAEAARIVLKAQEEAEAIRERAEARGRETAMAEADQIVRKQLATVIPALTKAVRDIQDARHAWLSRWEAGAIHVAAAIARRLVRRQLAEEPEITLSLVREALELAAGNAQLRILLNPTDYQSLGNQVRALVEELSPHVDAQIKADAGITAGGCRVETRFGAIDQQFDAQIERIEEELRQ
jgi:flagellar assembly protein FliH